MSTADELVVHYANYIKGKVIIITGVSPGSLGAYFVQVIAKGRPAWIILAAHDVKKAQQTEAAIAASNPDVKMRILPLDLESLQSVREAAAIINERSDIPVVDVLVNNAGKLSNEYGVTVDGFERQLATNHLGHFLFTNLIMDKILASSTWRIINISSDGHRLSLFHFEGYNFEVSDNEYDVLHAYGQTKTANILFSTSLAKRLGEKHGLLAFSLHPGVILTNAVDNLDLTTLPDRLHHPFFKGALDRVLGNIEGRADYSPDILSIEKGTATHVYAAFDPNLSAHNGAYLLDCRVADPLTDTIKPWATSPFEAEKLWRLSEKLVGQKFSY
ncbi:putative short-chain dehydrogenase [Gymnopilus junonius]|uniref:Short-chain dehydrogenase n=1 Tax=Gymnopilus junonius TaxID=109634 RepID=A0A9P5TH18_GYMJU|nr:putative short-chain dehydrogenase [Gymnopilus junonius]